VGLGVFLVRWFEWIFVMHQQNRNVIDLYVKRLQYFHMDSIQQQQLFYGSLHFVRGYPGKPVRES